MRAAIYARRSTDEHQIDSIEAQLSYAREYCARHGHEVVAEYTDTASGAEWALRRRPGIYDLRAAAERAVFDLVVVREGSRIGRDMLRAPLLLQELAEVGVRVLCYASGDELRVGTGRDKLITAIGAYKDEQERADIASRTRDALERRARAGLVAGGLVYGYRNVRSPDGVRREPLPAEAAVVVDVFERCASGAGLKAIAKSLNARGVPAPRSRGGWSPSAIGVLLRRELYVGIQRWGAIAKGYRGGTKVRRRDHGRELVTVEVPHLRIVSAELWEAVQARLAGRAAPRRRGRPERYLLSGILRCSECGGPLTVSPGRRSKEPIRVYCCARHRDRGTCPSTLRREVDIVDAMVLDAVRVQVLREELLAEVLAELRARLSERATEQRAAEHDLARRVASLREEVDRLVDAAAGAPAAARAPFYARVAERQGELSRLEDRLRAARTVPPALDLEVRRLERDARERLADLHRTAELAPGEARELLEALFPAGLVARPLETPEGRRMAIEGEADVGAALGLDDPCGKSASPAGPRPLPHLRIAA